MMRRRGFTLIEMITVMTVVSIAAAVVMPSVSVIITRIDDSRDRRVQTERLHVALDQVTRVVGEWPVENGELQGLTVEREGGDIVGLVCTGVGGFRLDAGTLYIVDDLGRDGWACDGIVSGTVTALGRADDTPLVADEDLPETVSLRVELSTADSNAGVIVYVRSMGGEQ